MGVYNICEYKHLHTFSIKIVKSLYSPEYAFCETFREDTFMTPNGKDCSADIPRYFVSYINVKG